LTESSDEVLTDIDIVTSAKNEAGNISVLYARISSTLEQLGLTFRLIVSDNSSQDGTWEEIKELSRINGTKVVGLRLSRDFGYEGSIHAALRQAQAPIVVVMASDLQDKPEDIPLLLKELEKGADHVYQVVMSRESETGLRRVMASLFYRIAHQLSGGLIIPNSSTFRAFTNKVLTAILTLPEKARFLRALSMYVGFNSVGVPFARDSRVAGKSKATNSHVVRLAVRGIVSNSSKLLDLIGLVGIFVSALSFLATVASAIVWINFGVPFAGFGTLAGIIMIAFGFTFFALGIMAQYMSLIYEEVKGRPDYFVSETTRD